MGPNAKKRSTRICMGLFFFLGGIEYAVILPTLWLYLEHRFDAEQWFFGVVFAAFCFANLFSSPFFGFWVDYTQKTKTAILFANLFEIGGNFLYFVAWSKYWVLAARLVSGTGAGIGAGIFAEIARTTTEQERTGVYSTVMSLRQFGLLVGPAFNLFLREFNLKLGPFKIDTFTAPGILMSVLWLLLEVVMLLFYFDLPKVHSSNSEAFSDYSINTQEVEKKELPYVDNAMISHSVVERRSCSQWINGDSADTSLYVNKKKPSVMDKWHLAKDLFKEEVVVILASQFMLFFNETAFETIVTPLTDYLLGWREVENSIAYCAIALEAILVFMLVTKLSRKIEDRWLIVIGVAFEGFTLIWYLFLLADAKPYDKIILPTVIVGTFAIVFGIPFFSVANISLYSKITDEKTQGIAQGIQRSVTGVAMIMGPLWGGALVHQLYVLLGVMTALEVILSIMIFLSFHRLKQPSKEMPKVPYAEIIADDERQPLLA